MATVLERLDAIEKTISHNNRKYETSVASILELMAAIIKTISPEFQTKVEETLNNSRKEADAVRIAEETKVFNDLISQGRLVAVDVAGPDTIIIGKGTDKNGNLQDERVQIQFEQFVPDAREKVAGKGVGFVYEAPESNLEIIGIYKFQSAAPSEPPVTEKPVEVPTEAK